MFVAKAGNVKHNFCSCTWNVCSKPWNRHPQAWNAYPQAWNGLSETVFQHLGRGRRTEKGLKADRKETEKRAKRNWKETF